MKNDYPDRFREDDRVITPSDEVAIVITARNGYVTARYKDALSEQYSGFTISERYLVRWEYGKPRPAPMRIAMKAASR